MKKTMRLLTCLMLLVMLLASCDTKETDGDTVDQTGQSDTGAADTAGDSTADQSKQSDSDATTDTAGNTGTEGPSGKDTPETKDDQPHGMKLSFSFIVKADHIEVFDAKSGELVQTLTFDSLEDAERSKELFTIGDMNFDGAADIRLPSYFGAYSVTYYCWLWDAEANAFVLNEQLSGLMMPSFDEVAKTVSEYRHISAAESTQVVYDWGNGALQELSRVETCFADDGVTLVVRTWERDSTTGEMVMSSEVPYKA